MIFAAKVGEVLSIHSELAIAELKADFWIISCNGYPAGAIEVKKPGEVSEAASNINYGQLYDYLLRIRSFHGIQNVLGLYTNWDDWVFGWLEDSDTSACADSLNYCLNEEVTYGVASSNRILHISEKYNRSNSKALAIALLSWFKKLAKNGPNNVSPVPLLHISRSYILLSADQWVWENGIPVQSLL
jgi:hypothetical protein